jgi:hypothetical protein
MNPSLPFNLEESKEKARSAVLSAGEAAEEFRQDFKAFLSQIIRPDSWRDGLKLVTAGGLGLLKDIQELLTQKNWSPDNLVRHLDQNLEKIVQKHPELAVQWENTKTSFNYAKMKTDEALDHIKEIAKREYGKFDQEKVLNAVWGGVKEEIKMDIAELISRFNHKEDLNG